MKPANNDQHQPRIRKQWNIGTSILEPIKASLAENNCTIIYEEKKGFWGKIFDPPIISIVVEGRAEDLAKVSRFAQSRAWI